MSRLDEVKPQRKTKRSTSDINFFDYENLNKITDQVNKIKYSYKAVYDMERVLRDRALVLFIACTGLRANEVLDLKHSQIEIKRKHIFIHNVKTLKHGLIRKIIIISDKGMFLESFKLINNWLDVSRSKGEYVFCSCFPNGKFTKKKLSYKRLYNIVRTYTGQQNLFPHFLRAWHENYMSKKIFKNNAFKLQKYMGLKSLEATLPYIQEDYEEDLKKL